MKMVKSLLLGSAAGLVAITAGQAAELPVKAKPVEYVKVCSLYGAGFYYMPGTDMCIKVGGWVRTEGSWGNVNGNLSWGPFNGNLGDRAETNFAVRVRGYITADAREQTAYGTARAYIAVGLSDNDIGTTASEPGSNFNANRAYIQWAGFTVGEAISFYDFYCSSCLAYRAGYEPTEDTGDAGWEVAAYTAQFGGGFSATLSAEARRMTQIYNDGAAQAASALFTTGAASTYGNYGYSGSQAPDVIGNLRVDQAWGSAQVMGAAHELNPLYYGALLSGVNSETLGHPSDQWGWVAGAGLRVNFPQIGPGDYLSTEVNYSQGAMRYLFHGEGGTLSMEKGAGEGYGITTDCVYGGTSATAANATGCEMTTGWSAAAGYEHYWTPAWHTALSGGYVHINYDPLANAMLCQLEGGGNAVGAGIGAAAVATAGCSNSWSYWATAVRTQWDITKSFYIGVELLYSQLQSATTFNGLLPASLGATTPPAYCATANNACAVSNENNWTATVRVHKDFVP